MHLLTFAALYNFALLFIPKFANVGCVGQILGSDSVIKRIVLILIQGSQAAPVRILCWGGNKSWSQQS